MRKSIHISIPVFAALAIIGTVPAAEFTDVQSTKRLVAERELARTENEIVNETIAAVPAEGGGERLVTNRWTRLAAGMHYRDPSGVLRETKEEIELVGGAAHATQGPLKAIWEANANQPSALRLETPEQIGLNASVLGIGYFDRATGKSVRLAEVRDAQGALSSSNQVLYADAFAGLRADIRYSYRRGAFEQDVILREMPPAPADFGLSPETTLVEIWTEFFDTPEPVVERRLVLDEQDSARRAAMVEPDIHDETLAFGSYQMVLGKVFWLADERNERVSETPLIAVAKRWIKVDGRSILIEAVPFPMVEPELMKLPKQVASLDERRRPVAAARLFPTVLASNKARPESGFLLAAAVHEEPGLVFDWVVVQPQSNYTFQNGQTYHVESGGISLSGTITFNGGAVIKFARDSYASLSISGDISCLSGSGPTILTAVHDNTVGQVISASPQSGRYGSPPYLNLYYVNNGTLNNMEFRFAKRAIDDYSPYMTHSLNYSKLYACDTGVAAYYTTWNLYAVNFCHVPTPWYDYGSSTFYYNSLTYDCTGDRDGDTLTDDMELTNFDSFNQTPT
jgi:hypothetical protein